MICTLKTEYSGDTHYGDKEIRRDKYDIELPQSIIESFARFLIPEIRKYYGSEQEQREFAEWEAAQGKVKKKR